jgi:hypothetical protein
MAPRDVHRRAELQTQFEVRLYFCQLHETGSREEESAARSSGLPMAVESMSVSADGPAHRSH